MSLTALIQFGWVPAALIVLAGLLVLHTRPAERAGRRFLLFLLGVEALLFLAVFITAEFPSQDRRLAWMSYLLAPSLLGVLAVILLNLPRWKELERGARAGLVGLLGLALAEVVWLARVDPLGMLPLAFYYALLLVAIWLLGEREITLVLAGLALVGLYGLGHLKDSAFESIPAALLLPLSIGMFLLPGLCVALAARLITTSLHRPVQKPGRAPVFALAHLALALLLLAALAYQIFWASIWDQTSDGLGGLLYSSLAVLVAVGAGMLMSITAAGRRRLAGAAFAILVPVLMVGAFNHGWDVSYHAITAARAARVQRALERFHARQGRYPQALAELSPRDLLVIPGPVILKGENWCYQGGAEYYRLGAFYREYFSTPLSLRIYASAGEPPETGWECGRRLEEMKARYDPPPFSEMARQIPTPAPQPTSQVPVAREPVQPLVRSAFLTTGSWSPDGRVLLFSQVEESGAQDSLSLLFMETGAGRICPVEGVSAGGGELRLQHAWLADGRLLVISDSQLLALRPCSPDIEPLAGRNPDRFEEIAASSRESGRVLLKEPGGYWILDSGSLAARLIPEVTPNPYELHWDQYAWSPSGDRLAISRLDGQDASEGSTLFLVAGDSAQVLSSLALDEASDQSAPIIEWVSESELLLHGQGELKLYDFTSATTPKVTRVLQDLFSLDLAYPGEISAMAALVAHAGSGYHLVVRANHPRNQAVYIYHSETGQVEVLHPETHALLFFPDSVWTEMPKLEYGPVERDEFELFWIDSPGQEPRRLDLQGHLPREYPHLSIRFLAGASQLAVGSQQGISLVSLPDGELLRFWELAGGSGISPHILLAPDEGSLIVAAEGVGLYRIPLPH